VKHATLILLFTTEEDIEGFRRARALAGGLKRDGWEARVVNRLSNNLDDLLLAAHYRAVQLPRWVVLRDGNVWMDSLTMPTLNQATRLLAKLQAEG
jgi:hypothetical protein